MNQRIARLTAGGCLAASAVFGLAGCALLPSPTTPTASDDAQSTSGSNSSGGSSDPGATQSVLEIHPGDCLTLPDPTAEQVSDVTVLPCSEPHQMEAFGEVSLTGSEFPGEDALQQKGEEGCGPMFDSWVADPSKFEYSFLPPTRGSWEQANDRIILCVAQSVDQSETTGSAGK